MTNRSFNARHGITVGANTVAVVDANGNITANTILVGNSSINSTSFSGTANNASNLNGQPASFYTNANNLSTGVINVMRLPTSGVTANVYGSTSQIPVITVDQYGRVTTVTTSAVAGVVSFTYTAANSTFAIAAGDASVYTATISPANSTVAGVVTVLDSVSNTSSLVAASANTVKNVYDRAIDANTRAASAQTAAISAYSNAISYVDVAVSNAVSVAASDATAKAGNAYSNAVTFASNVAATAYSNAVSVAASDATTKASNAHAAAVLFANSIAANAYSNAVTFASNVAATAYSNAVSVAASDATTKANNAYTTSVSAAATDATTKANNAYTTAVAAAASDATAKANDAFSNAVSNATSFASSAAATAYTNAISIASSDATNKAANAVSVAASDATTKANNAYTTAVAAAASDATTKANNAYTQAISVASSDATTKANNAYTTAIAAAATDATTKANNAYTQAVSAAASDATSKAANAYSNAVSVASSDATAKAGNAYSNAVTFASNATNISSGTLAEPRLPFRMNQNVRTTDSVIFANGSFNGSVSISGNLIVTGNLESTNVQTLAVSDPLIKLGVNNPADTSWGGFTFHYSGSGNTTNHAGLVRNPSTKEFLLMSTFGDEVAVANNNTINVSDPSFSYANLQVSVLTALSASISNNVGIGTTSPVYPLVVSNSGGAGLEISPNALASAPLIQSYNRSGSAYTQLGFDGLQYVFRTSGTERMRITSGGNVGIGTANPRGNLSVGTDSTANNTTRSIHLGTAFADFYGFRLTNVNSPGSFAAGTFSIQRGTTAAWVDAVIINDSGSVGIGTSSPTTISGYKALTLNDTTGSFIDFQENTTLRLRLGGDLGSAFINGSSGVLRILTSDVERVRITSAGNFGIGTTNPVLPLVVSNAGAGGLEFDNSGLIQSYNRSTSAYQNMTFDAAQMLFRPSGTERMRINSSGQLLLGTTTARTRLTVSGVESAAPTLGTATGTAILMNTDSAYGMMFGVAGAGYGWIQQQRVDATATAYDLILQPSGGNVGIGTASPQVKLDVVGANNDGLQYRTSTRTVGIGMQAGEAAVYWGSGTRLDFTSGGAIPLTIAANTGNVGIGTASPLARLVVSNGSNEGIEFTAGSATVNGGVLQYINRSTSTTRPDMNYYLSSGGGAHKFYTNDAERVRINHVGDVGIGATSIGARLEVYQSVGSTNSIRMNTNFAGGNSVDLNPSISGVSNGGYSISLNGTIRQVISAAGNVGIGTTSPAHPLDVNGIIRTNASVIGTFFADFNDSNFFMDPAGTSVLNRVRANSFFSPGGGVGRGLNPGGGQRGNNGASETGAIKITLPQSWSSTMLRFTVKVYDYATNTSFDVSCGGYNWSGSSWINTFGYIVGNPNVDRNYNIRFGHDGSRACVFIGELNSVWSYVQVAITDVQVGFSNISADAWADDWAISIVTSFPTLTGTTISNAQVGRLANIFYDSDNTSYYLDAASSSVLGSVSMFSTSDYQLTLNGNGTSWAGILFADVSNSDTMYYNGSTSTFSIGGGGSAVSGKKLHINGGATIGSGIAATAAPSQGLLVEGSIGAPSFYDSANSSFFVDPASGSVLNTLTTRGTIQINEGVSSGSNTAGLAVLRTSFAGGGQYRHSLVTRHNSSANTDNSWDFYVWRPEVAAGAEATHRAFIIDGGTGTTSAIASRAPIFIDTDNTARFVDPNSTSQMTTVETRGGNGFRSFIDGSSSIVSSIYFANAGNTRAMNWQLDENNDAALWGFDGTAWSKEITIGQNRTIEQGNNYAHPEIEWSAVSATGMTIFYLPGTVSNYGMVHMVFDIYEYVSGRTATVIIGGHNWVNAWYETGVQVVGFTNKSVRLGVKDGRFCVVFGGVGSSWSYGTIRLRKIHNASFYDGVMNLAGNWSTEFTNTESFTAISGDLRQLRTSNSFTADGDVRSPIFYDSNDTTYFFDGASTSRLNQARFQNRISIGDGNGTPSLNTGSPGVWLSYNGGSDIFMGAETSTSAGYWMSGVWRFLINSSGTATATGDFRAPIFYDSQNTSYYFDGAGTSQLNTVNVFGVMNMIGGTAQFWSSASGAYQRVDARNEGSAGRLHWYGVLTNGATSNFRHSYYDGSAYFDLTADTGTLLIARGGGAIVTSNGSFRAPVFFDSDNTGYYVDPNSTTSLRTAGSWRSDSSSWDGDFNGKIQYHDNSWYLQAAGRWEFRRSDAANAFIVTQAGECTARGDFRAPIFYDSNNTGYYVDPASSGASANWLGYTYYASHGGGVVGNYSSFRYQLVYGMGDAYKGALDGTSVAGGYGLWYSHPNAGGVASNLSSHGLMNIVNGAFHASLDASIRCISDMRTPIFYDLNNTAFYADLNGTMNINRIDGNGRYAIGTSDSYLRINETSAFSGGTWFGGTLVRGDGFYAGSSGGTTDSRVAILSGSYNGTNMVAIDGSNGNITARGVYARYAHNVGFLQGGYNNIGASEGQSSPIYCIGSSYVPSTTSLSNMYGIGFTAGGSFMPSGASGWGLYIAANGGARVFLDGDAGNITATGNITAYASDRRLKTNITPITNALDKLMRIRGVEFDWINNIEELGFTPQMMHETGVIAQEIQAVIPDAVKTAPFNNDSTKITGVDNEYLTVDKEKIVPLLIEAIKEQQLTIAEQSAKINTLEHTLERILQKLEG